MDSITEMMSIRHNARNKFKENTTNISTNISSDDFEDYSCVNDDVYCKCRGCKSNKANGGTCTHCFTCIDGERAMDICKYYED